MRWTLVQQALLAPELSIVSCSVGNLQVQSSQTETLTEP